MPRTNHTAHIKAELATYFVEESHALYAQSGNPIHAWRAFRSARQGAVAIPDWVLEYFDQAASVLTAREGPSSPKAIADAIGLGTKGGPSKAAQGQTDQRHLAIVEHILHLREVAASFPTPANLDLQDDLGVMQRVAGEHGLSLERVQAVFYEMQGPANPRRRRRKSGP